MMSDLSARNFVCVHIPPLVKHGTQVDVLDLLQIKSFAKAKDFGTFRETFAKDPDIYNITLKFASR